MGMSLLGALIAFVGIILVAFIWFSPSHRLARWAQQTHRWDYAMANARFQDARRTVVAQLRHPQGSTGKDIADAAFELAVMCTDRINQLNGKEHGPEQHERIRRVLRRMFQRDADYWGAGEYGIESLGLDQEPALFAVQRGRASITPTTR
jgi:hypothetical protein